MKPSLRRPRSPIVIALLLSLTLVIGLFMGWLSGSVISKDKAFRSLTRKIFQEEISGGNTWKGNDHLCEKSGGCTAGCDNLHI